MICLNLAQTKRVLPFSAMKLAQTSELHEVSNVLHKLARCSSLCLWVSRFLARSVQCFAQIGTMFKFVHLVGRSFGTKCPIFCTNWHDVRVRAFGWHDIWHEVPKIWHEVARRMHEEGSMLFR